MSITIVQIKYYENNNTRITIIKAYLFSLLKQIIKTSFNIYANIFFNGFLLATDFLGSFLVGHTAPGLK